MKLGIVGLPNVGKSTLFNAITNAGAEAANYPFCTIEPNIGIVPVPDERLNALAKMHNPEKLTHAVLEFVDIAGLVKGASRGEGLGNKFLSHIREVDAVVHVVRCFESGDIVHVDGDVNPMRDLETINLELVYSDIEILERRLERAKKSLKSDKSAEKEIAFIESLLESLNEGVSARSIDVPEEHAELFASYTLLSAKPVIYAANISEDEVSSDLSDNKRYMDLKSYAHKEHSEIIPICASIEAEIAQLDESERGEFLAELGITSSGLDKLVNSGYTLLNLISYLTAGPKEVRAWTITKGTKAPQAAGKIHTDFEKGFIRCEVVAYDDLMRLGTMTAAKEAGLVRSEGKEYVMSDGDIVLFRFNV